MTNADIEANRRGNGQFGNGPENSAPDTTVTDGLVGDAREQAFNARIADIDARLAATREQDYETLMAIGREGTSVLIKHQFPTATEAVVINNSDESDSEWIQVHKILDAEGNTLWSAEGGGYDDTDLYEQQEELSEYALLLDRQLTFLERLTTRRDPEETWRLPLETV